MLVNVEKNAWVPKRAPVHGKLCMTALKVSCTSEKVDLLSWIISITDSKSFKDVEQIRQLTTRSRVQRQIVDFSRLELQNIVQALKVPFDHLKVEHFCLLFPIWGTTLVIFEFSCLSWAPLASPSFD